MRIDPPADVCSASGRYGSKGDRINRVARLSGVSMLADVHERACDLGLALPLGPRRKRRAELIRRAGILFIHVPKNAGMSVNSAIYGEQMSHSSIRYYRRNLPGLMRQIQSFAIIRDPLSRFLSAYNYGRRGGASDNRISAPFNTIYASFQSFDDALDHIETAASPYAIDYVFRPQSWFVTDRHGGIAVDRLVLFTQLDRLADFIPVMAQHPIAHLNEARPTRQSLLPSQIERLRAFYAADFAIFEKLQLAQ